MTDLHLSTPRTLDRTSPSPGFLMGGAIFYLGVAMTMGRANVTILRWPSTLVIGGLLALIGWRHLVVTPVFKRYLVPGLLLAGWIVISSVAAWADIPLYRGRNYAIWLAVIIPGLGSLLRHRTLRSPFVGGLVVGASVYGFVVLYRMLTGVPVFDPGLGFGTSYVFGINRNIGAAAALLVLPLILSDDLPQRMRRFRWPLAALNAFWIIRSESRLVVIGAAIVGLLWVIIQPGARRKFRKLSSTAFVALVVLLLITEIGGNARVSFDRVLEGFSDEGGRNETRRLLVRKGWHLAVDNPIFGIGVGNFPGAYHPVLEEASNTRVRRQALNSFDHNGYAGLLAEGGFPAFGFLLLLFVSLLAIGIKNRRSGSVRIAMCSFVFALVYMTAASFGTLTFVGMILILSAAMEAESETAAT